MPWNDNANPGPWGQPPPGDDGGGPGEAEAPPPARREAPRRRRLPPPPGGPDLGDWARRLRDEVRRLGTGPSGKGLRPPLVAGVVAVIFVAWLMTGAYTVQANQEAVITRFGGYARSEGPGLHYHLPTPIDRAKLVPV
ncbi:MAG: FtsH protease activity modulator HflK, partial [Caulobacteraceae bacterium]